MHLPLEDAARIRQVAQAVGDEFGRADMLVNCAGFTRSLRAPRSPDGGQGLAPPELSVVRREARAC